jgi:hypothetical protein
MKRYFSASILAIIAVTAGLIIWLLLANRSVSPGVESTQTSVGQIQVSRAGGQIFTNVSGESLQQGSPPARSAAAADVSPQQATPNYCTGSELPVIDGCIQR